MEYTCETTINKPLSEVIELFTNPENTFKWMTELQKFNTIEGNTGELGAISEIEFKMGARIVKMTEKMTEANLPQNIKFEYKTKGMYNTVDNQFKDLGDGTTLYRTINYFKFERWSMKLVAALMPGAFKKQSMKYVINFKNFAELQA